MTKNHTHIRRVVTLIGSSRFFWVIIALFVLQTAWIALSGRYPMAFDEDFHLGIIRLYAHHLSPFWASQPSGADVFGAVGRDPSYFYQYAMSFPYRLIAAVTSSVAAQVLCLRAINIGLFAAGLAIYRRLLLKTGASRAMVHASLLIFILIPVVSLLAAQINYDNLFIPLVGLLLLLTVNFSEELQREKHINSRLLLGIISLGLLVSLVKYASLPIVAVSMIYLAARLMRVYKSPTALWRSFLDGCAGGDRKVLLALMLVVILAGGLFVERYGVNLIRYHTPVADCSQVLSERQCSAYGPWIRDHILALNKGDAAPSPVHFTSEWVYGMWLRLFFAVDGPTSQFQTRGPLPVPAISAIVFASISAGLVLRYSRRIFARYNGSALSLLAATALVYVIVLYLNVYQAYARTGQPVAINGRYLLPVLPVLILFSALAFGELLKRQLRLKLLVTGGALLCLLWGGGALTYILRSSDNWYWPSPAVRAANHAVQRTLGPVTPGYNDPTEFLR